MLVDILDTARFPPKKKQTTQIFNDPKMTLIFTPPPYPKNSNFQQPPQITYDQISNPKKIERKGGSAHYLQVESSE